MNVQGSGARISDFAAIDFPLPKSAAAKSEIRTPDPAPLQLTMDLIGEGIPHVCRAAP